MGASKKDQMKYLEENWADQIWEAAKARNGGKGAAWLIPLAAISVTGARPASLERGIVFQAIYVDRQWLIEATIPGCKILKDQDGKIIRGQENYSLRFDATCSRDKELMQIAKLLTSAPNNKITVQYDAEAISTRIREVSKEIWPRKKYHASAYCYRELFSANAKGSGMEPEEIAAAMGHLSTESQGKYSPRSRKGTAGAIRPCKSAKASEKIKAHRSPMSRFKNATRLKKRLQPN